MAQMTEEYKALVRATAKLESAVKHNITPLCAELVSCELITPDQKSKLRNPNHDVSERAADLVEIITNKVKQDPKNYDTFLKILQEDRTTYGEVLALLERPFTTQSTPEAPTSGECDLSPPPSKRMKIESPITIEECSAKLSQFYVDLRSAPNSWPPLKLIDFVQLALIQQHKMPLHIGLKTVRRDIDEVCGEKTQISVNSLFEKVNHGSLILLEGRPGSGKTTLMLEIACKSQKEIFEHAKLVILVRLRQLSQTGDIYLSEVLKASCNRLSSKEIECIRSFIERECGENVVFLFDGYDEYSYGMSENNIVKKILTRQMFTKSVVVVSSRPAATIEFRRTATKYIEVVGFLKAQVFHYIKHFFENTKEKASSLILHLESHPNLLNICYLPLHCAMLVFLAQEDSHLPKTETEFYRCFALTWMFRYSHKTGVYPSSLNSFNELNNEDKQQLDKVCCLAYHATLESKQVFTAQEVKDISGIEIPSQQDTQCGLEMLVIDRIFVLTGVKKTYSFFHLTIQEFLAALYLCSLKDQEKVYIIKRYGSDGRLLVTLRFLCGMMDYSTLATQMVFDGILEATKIDCLFHIQCSDEFQSPLSCTHVFNFHQGSFSLENLKPSDSTSLVYFVKNAQCSDITLKLHSCSFDVREYEAVLQAFGDRQVSLTLRYLNCLPLLFAIARVGVPGLTELSFYQCKMEASGDLKNIYGESSDDSVLTNLPIEWTKQCPTLKKIVLETYLDSTGMAHVANGIAGCKKLKELKLGQCNLKGDTMECLKGCPKLEGLSFTVCEVNGDTVEGLRYCSNLKSLTFDGCGLKGVTMECLKHCPKLESLSFTDCDVNGDTVECLKYCSNLKSLTICGENDLCHLDNSTWQVLGETLQHCSRLQQLNLSWTDMKGTGMVHVAKGMAWCKELKELNLSLTEMDDTGMAHVAKGIVGCKELKELNLRNNSLHDDGVKILVEVLLVNCKDIRDVNLDLNGLRGNSVPCLIDFIKSVRALERLVLVEDIDGEEWDNHFTPRRWSEMEEAVRSRTEDMSKLQLIGKPLLSDDELLDESNNLQNEYHEQAGSSNADNETFDCECST